MFVGETVMVVKSLLFITGEGCRVLTDEQYRATGTYRRVCKLIQLYLSFGGGAEFRQALVSNLQY